MGEVTTIAGGVLFAATVLAVPASADPIDAEFPNDLREHAIWYTDPQTVINYAHGICAEMAGGRERADIAASVLRDNPAFGNWNNADWFLIIANTDYCPWLQSPPPEPGTLGGGPE
jgi:hypothetical protein